MKPVWMVRSRQIAQKLSFWLMLIGYDLHDHSLNHRIYLIYASVFMSLWGFAVLALAAGATATVLTSIGNGSANQVAVQISLLLLGAWSLFQLWQVSRRSPFIFSEEDAHLICQTPVNRSVVAICWFVGDWFTQALPFWAIIVIFGFAMVEVQLAGNVTFADFFLYVASGLRALSAFFPLHLGLLAGLWALGALRLHGIREWRWFPRLVLIGILLIIGSLVLGIEIPGWAKSIAPIGQSILWPLNYPLRAAFSISPWINGVVVASGIAVLGLMALAIAGHGLNLSRAAQESTQREKIQTAQRYGMLEVVHEVKRHDRLGVGREPTRLPARPGLWILPWKDVLQSRYEMGFGGVWNWLLLLGLSVGVFLTPDFSSRIFLCAFWVFALGQRVTSRLRVDLANWWILRSLPFQAERVLLAELVIPWSLTVILGWLAIIIVGQNLEMFRLAVAFLMPFVCLIASLISAYDILRQAKSGMLLNGNAPGISVLTILGGMLCLGFLVGIAWWLSPFRWISILLSFGTSVLFAYGIWRMAANKYRSIS